MTLAVQRLGTALAPSPAMRGAVISAGAIVALAAAEGGFFPSSWRVGSVVLAGLACMLALWTPVRRTTTTTLLFAPPAGLAVLSLASAAWSADPSASLLDVQRTLLYLVALACFALAGEGLAPGVVVGAASVGAWALVGRAVHGTQIDPYEGRLLTGPIGYANGLGALMAIGIAVCVALALGRRQLLLASPLAVLVPALALTASRGSVLAAIAGCAVAAALVTRHRSLAAGVVVLCVAALAVVLVFTPAVVGDRAAYWSGARATVAAHPLEGTGAGTFGLVHLRAPYARDAHSLYLQTASELGVPGLLLLLAFLTVPLVAALRRNLAGPAAGLTVFVLHAGIDWDWQLPAVTVAALALAAAAAHDGVQTRAVTEDRPSARRRSRASSEAFAASGRAPHRRVSRSTP